MKTYDYNNPIKQDEITIIEQSDNGRTKKIRFKYKDTYYEQKYNYGKTWGFKFILEYPNEQVFNNPLAMTGEKIIYSSTLERNCTDLGRFIEYSISKLDIHF